MTADKVASVPAAHPVTTQSIIILILGWLLPGAGHFLLKKWWRGVLLLISVLAMFALFTVVPRRERAYVAPILPLYFLYALVHTAPMTVGFGNWVALRLWGRRLYRDHYQAHEDDTVRLPRLARNGFRAPAA